MSFSSFGEFLRWSHASNYGEAGLAATAAYDYVPYDLNDEIDARNMAKTTGDPSRWPSYLEQIIFTNLRVTDGYEGELEIDV